MRLRLTPKDESFYDLFAEAGNNLVQAADLLATFISTTDGREEMAAQLKEYEHANDTTTHRIFRRLNTSFITPFDREDIYALASNLDDVMDAMEAAADLVVLTGLGELPSEMASQAELLQRACRETADAMPRLRTTSDLNPYWIEVNRIENEADLLYRRLLSRLFSGDYDALTVMKLKEVADMLEEAADVLEHVANAVETIAVKES